MPVVEAIELTKTFKDFWGRQSVKALDSVNFDVNRGEVFGLLGPNGSGKTTTVRIILGLLFPTQGAVRLFGQSPRTVDVKKRVGYMPEESHLYTYLTAEETLDFFGRLFRLAPEERRRRTDALIEMVGLNRARRRPLGQYSKGMARRIGLAQALINDPDFLILDEPTTGLDPIGARQMKDLILTLRDRGKTILLCSHLLGDVEEICDRICILYGGKQRAMGTVGDLLAAEDVTQIRMPRLDEEQVSKVIDAIGAAVGSSDGIEVSAPTKRLEEFFLQVVEDARRERLQTAGAEAGTVAASFLMGGGPGGEDLVAELVQAGRHEEPAGRQAQAQPAIAAPTANEGLIRDLVEGSDDSEEEADREEQVGRAGPDREVRRDVLDELMADDADGGKRDEG
jgi:ABC-2 type transport system ATP-binding protein